MVYCGFNHIAHNELVNHVNPWVIEKWHLTSSGESGIHWSENHHLPHWETHSGGRISVDALDRKGGRWMIWWVKLNGCIHKRYGSNGQKHSRHLKLYDTICWMSIHTGYQSALLWKQGFDAQPSFRGKGKNGGWVEIGGFLRSKNSFLLQIVWCWIHILVLSRA